MNKVIFRIISILNASILILALLLSFALIVQYFLNKEDITEFAMTYGYNGILICSFLLEVSFQLIGPDVLLATGIVIGMNTYYLLASIITGSLVAGFIGYYLGLVYGNSILNYTLNREKADKAIGIFEKYGKVGLTLLALTPMPYFPILGGIFRLRLNDFIIFALLPRSIRYMGLAYILSYFE
jgi:membrane protein YqaA with SNARE-associated domain